MMMVMLMMIIVYIFMSSDYSRTLQYGIVILVIIDALTDGHNINKHPFCCYRKLCVVK